MRSENAGTSPAANICAKSDRLLTNFFVPEYYGAPNTTETAWTIREWFITIA